MDPQGTLVGLLLGLVAGLALGLWLGSGTTIARGGATPVSPPIATNTPTLDGQKTSNYVTKSDLQAFELRLEDAYDKLHHLYDRTRKRLRLPEEAQPPALPPADQGLSIKEKKARLRLALAARRRGE